MLLAGLIAGPIPTALSAQSSSSASWFVPVVELGSGGRLSSPGFELVLDEPSGIAATSLQSASFRLVAGFPSTLEPPITGLVVSGVRPLFAAMRSQADATIHGRGLDLGATPPQVTVGGQPAAVRSRAPATLTVALPDQPVPGWQPVVVTGQLGSAALPTGIGILPMLELERPAVQRVPTGLRYRGTPNDQFVIAIGSTLATTPWSVPGFGYELRIAPPGLLTTEVFTVSDPSGVLSTGFPALPSVPPILLQGFTLSANPGYAPGSFTNLVRLVPW
jgi:hypothetical protein